MELLGTIRPNDSATVDRNAWIALISAHSLLASVASRQGVNPFTKKPYTFKAPADYARVMLNAVDVGAVNLAEDGSNCLVVRSAPTAKKHVTAIAQDIAARLGMRFVPD